jgi:hypothetical protein
MDLTDSAFRSGGGDMVTTIILALGVLTAALVVGVFAVALIELNEIDEIIDGPRAGPGNSLLGPVSTVGPAEV